MNLQDVADHCQDDAVRNANSDGTVEGNHFNDSSTPAAVSEIPVESQAALPGVGALEDDVDTVDDVTLKDVSESINQDGEVKESQTCNLQADPYESIEVGTKVGDKQILESLDGLEGNADCAPQPTEIQNVTLDDESVALSDNTAAEVQSGSKILVTISEEAPTHEGDSGGEKIFEVKEWQPCNLQADLCESVGVDTNFGNKQISESSDGLEGNADCAPQPTEIQNVTLEDESVSVSDNTVRSESEILVTISEEAPAHDGDNGGEKVFDVKESQPCNLQADPCESVGVDTTFGNKQISQSSDGLEGNADCAPQPTNIQNVTLDDEFVSVSDNTAAEVRSESEILVTISEEAPAHDGDNGGEKVFDVKESQPFNLQAGPCESNEVDRNFGDKPILESSDGLEGNADCAPEPAEIQHVTLEDESVAVSDNTAAEVRPESEILVSISEEAPAHEGDNGGEKVFDVEESQPCNLQADPCGSNEVDTNFGDKPILESSDGLEGNADCAPQPTEIQNVTLEDESVSVSDNMPEARLDSKILDTISEEAPPHEGDNDGEKIFEIKESLPFNLQVDPCESFEVDKNFGVKQTLESSDGLEGNADCTPQPTETQNVTLEDKSVAVSDDTAEVRSDSEILVRILEEAPPLHEGDNGGEKVFEDTRTKVIPEPKEIQDTITELCQNGQFEVEPGLRRTEESGKESVCGPFCKGNESFSPVLSVNDDTVSDRKECYQNIVRPETELGGEDFSEEATSMLLPEPNENNGDITVACENGHFDVDFGLGSEESGIQSVGNSETPCDLHPSSSISNTPVPALKVPEPHIDLGGENILVETKMKLLPKLDDNEHAIAEVCDNGHFEVDLGLGTGEPGTESAGEASSKENESHSPVLSANHSVLERHEFNQHIDDSETSSELHLSSSISNTPIVSSSCVIPETRERPDQCTENAHDICVSKGHDVDQEASSGKGVGEVQFFENLGPENEENDALAVESVENGYYITKDKKLEIESCVAGATMTVTDQAAQSEDSTGGDTNISPPEEAARLENKTSISVKVDEFSCSDAHSSIEEIVGTEPVLGTTDFVSEMTTLHGVDLDSKNEIVHANVMSSDILTVVSNAESDFKQENSSSILNSPIVVSSFVKPESDIREMSGQRSDNVPDIDVLHRHEVDQEAPFCEEIGEVQLLDDLRPESVSLGVKNSHYITDDKKLEIKSCVLDTVIDQAAQIDDSAGGDTNFSSPVKAARLENKAMTNVEVDGFSCCDAYSSIEDIHGTDPALEIADSEREISTVHGGDMESKNEIGLAYVKSSDILIVVANADSDFKKEYSSTIGDRNMSSSDDSEKAFQLLPPSSITNTPIAVSNCVKAEIEVREKPGQISEDVSDIGVLQRHEVNKEASCKENGEVQFLEDVRPESEDLDASGVESVENGYYITEDQKLEMKSCVPDATITVIHQAAEIENSAGGDTNFSSPGKIARLENMAATIDNVEDYSCNEGLSSVEYIHGTELVLGIVDPERKTTTFQGNDLDSKNEIVLVNVKKNDVPTVVSNVKSDFEQENSFGIGSGNVSSSDVFASDGDLSGPVFDDNLSNLLVGIVDIENKEEHLFGEDVNMNENLVSQERHDVAKSNVTLAEISDVAARNGQEMCSESLVKPFHFLVKLPRFDDTIIREQVRQAQLLVEEKTRLRDAFRLEIVNYRFNCREHASRYEAARDEARASKRAVRSKRAEIDSIQTLLNKVKNALSVEDIDARIVNLEHMIEHETLLLKEEKQFIREIKQLKLLREQLSSNLGCQDEVQQALNNRDQIEGSLKALKKELDGLKECVLKAEAVARAVEKIYEGDSRKLKEVQAQFEAADNVRQTAYEYMQSLRREMYEKNQQFRMYRHDATAAYDHATKRETEALHNLCFNQVESTMELWNKDPEFRKEYVRCNMRSTVRRLGTLDGRSLGPGEKPQMVSNSVLGGVDRMDHRPRNPSPELPTEILQQQEGQEKHNEVALSKEDSKVTEEVPQSLESKTSNQGQKVHLENSVGAVSGSDIAKDVKEAKDVREEEHLPDKEELELARKAEELRKEEVKEQRRLEEKAKALEALERKKKNAEKAQLRAELRAQKEAEQKEKEKEKRQRKKERKKATTSEASDADNLGQTIAKSERVIEQIKDPGIKETSTAAVSKRNQKTTKLSKTKSTIPPPLRNRGRKKLQQWIWGIVTILMLVFIFIVTNVGFSSKLSINLRRPGNA